MMKTAYCSQCGKLFPAYDNRTEFLDCRSHIRAFFFHNPEYFKKQIHDYSEYFTTEERRNLMMGLGRVA